LKDLAHFNGPELPVDQVLIVKKYFFININNIEGFLLQQHNVRSCFRPSNFHSQRNVDFVLKIIIFKALGAKSNVLIFYTIAIGTKIPTIIAPSDKKRAKNVIGRKFSSIKRQSKDNFTHRHGSETLFTDGSLFNDQAGTDGVYISNVQ
jgi:hypothetical protein